jgi:hypothetical protein
LAEDGVAVACGVVEGAACGGGFDWVFVVDLAVVVVSVVAFGVSGADPGASSGGGSWANARPAQQRKSPIEPSSFARVINRLSRMSRINTATLRPLSTSYRL